MVEVNVRQEYKIDSGWFQPLLLQGIQQQRYAVIGARIDKRAPTALRDQVTGILNRAKVLGIDGDNAIVEGCYLGVTTQV